MTRKILIILQVLLVRQSVLMPVLTGLLAAAYHAFKPSSLADPHFDNLANWIFVVIGTLAAILGAFHDASTSRLDNVAQQTGDKLTQVGRVVNNNADIIDPRTTSDLGTKPVEYVKMPLSVEPKVESKIEPTPEAKS